MQQKKRAHNQEQENILKKQFDISQKLGSQQRMLDELRRDLSKEEESEDIPLPKISRPLSYEDIKYLSDSELFKLLQVHIMEHKVIVEELLNRKIENIGGDRDIIEKEGSHSF